MQMRYVRCRACCRYGITHQSPFLPVSFSRVSEKSPRASRMSSGRWPLLLHPFVVVIGGVNGQMTEHAGVAESTEFGAGEFVPARLGRLEPGLDLPSRDGVLLQAQVGKEEAVDDILCLEGDPNDLAHRHVQLVVHLEIVCCSDLSIGPGVQHLPVELFGSHLDVNIRGRHTALDMS